MTQAQFDFLCEKLGDPSLPVAERWKSIQYIHVHGSYEPMGSFQEMYKRDQIYYYEDDTLGGGFFYLSTPDAAYDPIRKGYTVSWIGLDAISEITFKGFHDYEIGEKIYGISDVMSLVIGKEVSPLPTSIFVDSISINVNEAKDFNVATKVKSTRPITESDFEISYYDMIGTKLDAKPTTVGKYTVKVKCIGNYIGEASARYQITI